MTMQIPKLQIKPKSARSIQYGHPWIFSGAIQHKEEILKGQLCHVYCRDSFIGCGYYNPDTNIAVRMIRNSQGAIDLTFFREKFSRLMRWKRSLCVASDSFRLVFGENDGIPGLVVDLFNRHAILQCHTAGIDVLKPLITKALIEACDPRCIIEKKQLHSRKIEKISQGPPEILFGKPEDQLIITENDIQYQIDFMNGQKTGHFLDQRENRRLIQPFVKNRKMLDCFCYSGGFTLNAAPYAQKILAVDSSEKAIEGAITNACINKVDSKKAAFLCADVFKYLKTITPSEYDFILLDPPAMTKTQRQKKNAINGYISLNSEALKKLPDGGILATASCTAHVSEDDFHQIIHQSSIRANCIVRVLATGGQPFDHAVSGHFPEGRYLKFLILMKETI